MTYDLLASSVLTSSASSVTFSSISQDYRDLILVMEVLAVGGDNNPLTRLNGDTGSNYPTVTMDGDGSVASSFSYTSSNIAGNGATTTAKALNIINIMDYSATDKHKTALLRSNRVTGSAWASAVRWADTSAVTSVSVTASANSFAVGSSFYLYGVAA